MIQKKYALLKVGASPNQKHDPEEIHTTQGGCQFMSYDDDDEDDDKEGDHYYDYEYEDNDILLLIVIIILMFTLITASHADTHSTFTNV